MEHSSNPKSSLPKVRIENRFEKKNEKLGVLRTKQNIRQRNLKVEQLRGKSVNSYVKGVRCPVIPDHKRVLNKTKVEGKLGIIKEEPKGINKVADRFRSIKERENNEYEEVKSEIMEDYNDAIGNGKNIVIKENLMGRMQCKGTSNVIEGVKCEITKEISDPLKSMKEGIRKDMFMANNAESEYLSSTLIEDSPIMNIPSASTSKYNPSISAAIKTVELKMSSGITLPKPLSLTKKREEIKVRSTDSVYGVSEITIEDEGLIFNLGKDTNPKVN